MAKSSGRINSIQGLRAVAFLSIFGTHLSIIKNWAALGVSIFVVMSGFLMSLSYFNKIDLENLSIKGNIKFTVGKMKRLYPLHIIMLCVAIGFWIIKLITHMGSYNIVKDSIALLSQIFLIQGCIPVPGIYYSFNAISWYLSISMILYFFFPWILKFIKSKSTKSLIITSIIVYAVMWGWTIIMTIIFKNDIDYLTYFNYVNPMFRIGDFGIGAIFGVIFIRIQDKITDRVANIAYTILIPLTIPFVLLVSTKSKEFIWLVLRQTVVVLLPIAVAYVFIIASNKGFLANIFSTKPFVYVGDISPYGFLIHQEVIVLIATFGTYIFQIDINKWLLTTISVLVTWICIVIYQQIDKKFIKKDYR